MTDLSTPIPPPSAATAGATPAPPGVAPDAPLAGDEIACSGCGYNLRTIAPDARCPECGAPAADSFRQHALRLAHGTVPLAMADQRWLRMLRRACALLLLSGAAPLALSILAFVPWFAERGFAPRSLVLSLWAVSSALFAAGVWWLTAREPGATARERRDLLRFLIRAAAGVFVGAEMWLIALVISAVSGGFQSTAILFQVINWTGTCLTALTMAWVAVICRRAGRPGLWRAAVACALLVPAGAAAVAIAGYIDVAPNSASSPGIHPVFGPIGAAPLVCTSLAYQLRLDLDVAAYAAGSLAACAAIAMIVVLWRLLARMIAVPEVRDHRPGA